MGRPGLREPVVHAVAPSDLPIGLAVPAGHGHEYTGEHVDGWAAVLQPDGWSAAEAAELREIVMAEPNG